MIGRPDKKTQFFFLSDAKKMKHKYVHPSHSADLIFSNESDDKSNCISVIFIYKF